MNIQAGPARKSPPSFAGDIRKVNRLGFGAIGVFMATIGAWAAFASVSNAVIAQGQFVADGNVKKVQHQTGGIVGAILVRDGDMVKGGDVVVRLDDTVLKANLQIIVTQLDEMAARSSRLEAERDQSETMAVPPRLASRLNDPEITAHLANERRLFEARRSAREGLRAQLGKRIQQTKAEIDGISEQRSAKALEARLIQRELLGVRDLFAKNLVQITRLGQLEREAASLTGQHGQLTAQIAQAEGRIAETQLQILQQQEDLRAEAMKELRDIHSRMAELNERRVAAEDQLQRVDIRAPVAGIVHQSAAHTIGGVVTPAEPVMLVVPSEDALSLEVRIAPPEIDQIFIGQNAQVKLHAFNQRITPEFKATVTRLGKDVVKDPQTGAIYYIARLTLAREGLTKAGSPAILPGMQADAFIDAGARTPFEYLIKPIRDQFSRAFRER